MASKSNSRTRSASSTSSSAPTAKRQKITVAPFLAAFPRRTLLSSSRWVNKVPHDIWVFQILNPFLDLKALSTLGRCNTFFEEYWQYVLKLNVIRVPEGCPNMNQAMDVAVIFSERNNCTMENPVKVEVGEGKYVMVGVNAPGSSTGSLMNVSCNNIAIVGKGKGKTTILGGFRVYNQQNVKFEALTVANENGPHGLLLKGSKTNADILMCIVKQCRYTGTWVEDGATVTATGSEFMENGFYGMCCVGVNTKASLNDCKMHHNGKHGMRAFYDAVVDLHGTKTDIHSNKLHGIAACTRAKVNIHLPSQHNTSHDNVGEDRVQWGGGSIANTNADGTFTHVEEDEEEDEEGEWF